MCINLSLRTCLSYFNKEEFLVLGWDFFLPFVGFVCLGGGGVIGLLVFFFLSSKKSI